MEKREKLSETLLCIFRLLVEMSIQETSAFENGNYYPKSHEESQNTWNNMEVKKNIFWIFEQYKWYKRF